MQDPALGRQQPVVGRLLHERMTESIAFDGPVLVDEQELGVDRAAQGQAQVGVGQPADLGEERRARPAGRRRRRSRPACRRPPSRPRGGPGGRRAGSRAGARGCGRGSSAAAASSSAKNALPSERRDDGVDQGRARGRAGDAGQQLDELATLEPRQVDALDARLALGLGQPRRQRMAAMQFVAPEGRDHEQSLVAGVAGQEGEQVAGRTVGPVQVLDDEQDRVRLAEPAEQPQGALEDAGLEPFGLARRRRPRPPTGATSGTSRASSGRLGPAASAIRVGVDLAGQRREGLRRSGRTGAHPRRARPRHPR